MADLRFINQNGNNNNSVSEINRAYEKKKRKIRRYLGMSEIGGCARRLWFNLNRPESRNSFDGRLLRLFRFGELLEIQLIRDLKKAGFEVTDRQKNFSDYGGAFAGHIDGIIAGLKESSKPHILEIKSANDNSFKLFLKNGVTGNPYNGTKYIAQVQCYMGYSGLSKSFFVIVNKNDSSLYQERIEFDKSLFEFYRQKAADILTGITPAEPARTNECRFCSLEKDCFPF